MQCEKEVRITQWNFGFLKNVPSEVWRDPRHSPF
jgi:hypothetical protein